MSRADASLAALLEEVRACRACEKELPLGPRPVLRASTTARVLVVGQAPGTRVHKTGIPWNDPSGDELRAWLGIEREVFYDESRIAIIPMGFCYPGRGARGDLPPRRECAELWFDALWGHLASIRLTLLVGMYAQGHFLGRRRRETLSETVRNFRDYLPDTFPLPHPSPRNRLWRRERPWFEEEVLPALREHFREAIGPMRGTGGSSPCPR